MSDVILGDVVEQVEAWTLELAEWRDRVAPVFARPEPREIFGQLVAGLLSSLPKKNGWTLAEYAGHTHPGRVQTCLSRGAWDAGELEDHVRDLVIEEMGDSEAVLIVDDTQMIKKGTTSVGVAPQPAAPARPPAQGPLDPLAPDPPRPRPNQSLPPTRRTTPGPSPRIGQRSPPITRSAAVVQGRGKVG
jgi:hypothetical protein